MVADKRKRHDELPIDIIYEILVLLPVKTLSRFKCISKPWCSLISSPPFQEAHFQHSQKNPLLLIAKIQDRDLHLFTYSKEGALLNTFSASGYRTIAFIQSCRGLVCIDSMGYHNIVRIYNPSTQDLIPLPPTQGDKFHCLGFGYAASTNEYKVVRFFCNDDDDGKECYCQVFTLGTTHWRDAKTAPFHVNLFNPPPFLQGAIHLQPSRENYPELAAHDYEEFLQLVGPLNVHFPQFQHDYFPQEVVDYIAAFDIETEEYRKIPLPKNSYCNEAVPRLARAQMKELGGLLSLSLHTKIQPAQLELWLLRDYNNGEWLKYNIDLSPITPYIRRARPVAILDDGQMLLNLTTQETEIFKYLLCWYDIQDKILPHKSAGSESTVYGNNNDNDTTAAFWEDEKHNLFGMVTLYAESLMALGSR